MLVLTRRAGQAIMLGDDVEVTVVEVVGDHVRLGISAPAQVTIHRKEVYLRVLEENLAATRSSREDVSQILGAPASGQPRPAAARLRPSPPRK